MNAGIVEWLAIGLAFVAVMVILRYGRRPRCERCDALAPVPPAALAAPAETEWPLVTTASEGEWTTISWKVDHAAAPSGTRRDVKFLN